MESNSDKQLRDKLKGVEFPFDPQAWEKMEAMLEEKKKRRVFFWWWTGGIAAVLLLAVGTIGWGLYLMGEEDRAGNEQTQIAVNNKQLTEDNYNEVSTTSSVAGSDKRQAANKPISEGSGKSVNGNQTPAADTEGLDRRELSRLNTNGDKLKMTKAKTTRKYLAQNQSKSSHESVAQNVSLVKKTKSSRSHSLSAKEKLIQRKEAILAAFKNEETNTSGSSVVYNPNPFKEEVNMLAASAGKNSLAKRIEMDGRAGFLESSEEKYFFDKKSEDALPKTKKRIFNYSLGVLANVTGTILDNPDSLRGFYNKPSYAVGFTHEFLFIKRIAITNTILYAQTGFKVNYPVAPIDSSAATKIYSAAISELQIPIGIKAYPVVKKYFRFYIAAGIINHIKLTEKFTVEKQTYSYSVVPNNIVSFDNTFVSSADNPFMQGLSKNTNTQGANGAPGELGEYYGMGGLRRYYASFYASAGVEFIAKKHFVFFTEPMFYLSLKKIGLQEKRKYNVGVSGGFRYQF